MNESELVWVRNLTAPAKKLGHSKSEVPAGLKLWLPGVVTSKTLTGTDNVVKVRVEGQSDLQAFTFPQGIDSIDGIKLRNMDEKSCNYLVDDLINLPFLNEPEILQHVKERFNNNIIYTLTGPILIVMNPLKLVKPSAHNDDLLRKYTRKMIKDAALHGITHDADHEEGTVFIQKDASHSNDVPGTSILVTGESNSGKTEVAKILTSFLLEGGEGSSLADKIVEAGLILESFGNAETMYSKNSSRYGKFFDIFYDENRIAVGGAVRSYLLEQTRVVNQMKGERNFHIFYELIAGATEEELAEWNMSGLGMKDFPTLMKGAVKGKPVNSDTAADKVNFDKLRSVLAGAFDEETIQNIFRIAAGVLQLGRLEFLTVDMGLSGEGCEIQNKDVLANAAKLLGFDVETLERTLTIRTIVSPRGETFVKNLTTALGINGRDAIAKAIFERLFSWIVKNLNIKIAGPLHARRSFSVSILDIYGFDAFLDNSSFEQLCINFVNEALQQQFNQQIFKMEIAEYENEGLSMDSMNFSDNQDSLDLIGLGIFKLLDDQCKIPKATDARLAQQMYKDFGATAAPTANKLMGNSAMAKMTMCEKFSASKTQQAMNQFCVEHFAGSVVYSVSSFIEKNMDELPADADELIQNSKNPILSTSSNKVVEITELVTKLQINTGRRGSILGGGTPSGGAGGTPVRHGSFVGHGGSPTPTAGTPQRGKTVPSAATQFKNELAILIRQINSTIPNYIRCIKPVSASAQFDEDAQFNELCVAEQVQYSGILEAVSVNRAGFPVKIGIYEFFARYSTLATAQEQKEFNMPLDDLEDHPDEMRRVTDILIKSIVGKEVDPKDAVSDWSLQMGKTKVFMKKRTLETIEGRRQAIVLGGKKGKAVVVIQAEFRGYLVRKRMFDEKKKAVRTTMEAKPMKVEEVPEEEEAVPSAVPSSETLDPLDSKKALTPSYARISQYLASKVSEFNKQDVALLKAINNIITASKANDQVAIISLDVDNSRHMLEEWTRSSSPGIFQLKLEEVTKLIDYGYKLLKSEKLIPKSVKTKLLSLGGKKKNSDEEKLKAAKTANKVITKEHKMFKGIYVAVEQIRELRNTATSEQTTFMKRMHRREDEYQQKTKGGTVSEQEKLTLKNLHEQENTKLIRQIQCAKKVTDICTSLEQYYLKYVSVFVEEYGVASDFKKSFEDENLYIIALTELIEESKPLLSAEKKALESGVKKALAKTSQELFPLTLPQGDNYKMSMITHQQLNFNFMPFLPGEEFLVNSLTMLLSGRANMHPIRFIKVMGRSKNNDGKVAYYQTSPGFTQTSLRDVLEAGTYNKIDEDSFTAMVLSSMLVGISDALPENFMMNASDPECIKVVGVQSDNIFSSGCLVFEKDGNASFESKVGSTFNSLFLLPNMDQPVACDIADIILNVAWAAEDIISSWMRELYMQNQRYQSLITSGFNAVDLDTLQLPMKLPSQSVVSIYKNLVKLSDFLRDNSEATNHELLSLLYPEQAKHYKEKRASAAAGPGLPKEMETLSDIVRAKPISKQTLAQKNKQSYIKTVETLSQEFTSNINFERISNCPMSDDPKRPHICSIIADNLAFLPTFMLKEITETQMLDMFRTSSTKSNTKELVLVNMHPDEVTKIKSNDELTAILVRHGLTLSFK